MIGSKSQYGATNRVTETECETIMDATAEFLMQFHDWLAPKLDTYEQAIYLYIHRHSRLIGKSEIVIGFKSSRTRMACGVGEKGKPMSENTAYVKLSSLAEKGCVQILDTLRAGRKIKLFLPCEIPNLITEPPAATPQDIEEMDFFSDEANRQRLLEREDSRCFYCLKDIHKDNYVIEHVVSRPEGDNGYRNLVAACRSCNNRKGDTPAEEYLRILYREGFLAPEDLQDRIQKLHSLRKGDLKPNVH